jgi:hypothetical protein
METMRESRTDERMDDLSHRVDQGFERVDADIRELRTEMNTRFDAMQRTLFLAAAGIVAALIGLIATQL